MSESEFEQVLAEFLAATEANDEGRQADLKKQFPQYAEEIEAFLRIDQQLASSLGGEPDGPSGPQNWRLGNPHILEQLTRVDGDSAPGSSSTAWSIGKLAEIEFPASFGPYQLLSEIDRGGMGIVFKARHQALQRIVALKVLRAGELATPEEVRRFRVEAEASAALKHPNIIPIYEVGETHGLLYFTMAYIDGEDLSSAIKHRRFQPRESARILLKIAEAVSAAHRQGIIHRDLKPSNILIDSEGQPHLADFGLAKLHGFDDELTHTGQILGTPAYMSPEQARGTRDKLTDQVDVYSLGAVLYAMLTGQAPFSGPTPFDILLQVLDREPPAPSRLASGIPRSLETICLRAMSKESKDRYATAADLAADLERFLKDEPIEPPRPALLDSLEIWWRREPILVSHLCGIGMVAFIVLISFLIRQEGSGHFAFRFGLMSLWAAGAIGLQQLSLDESRRDRIYLSWATFDIVVYTVLIYFASPPRGLLLIGYPMMIAASGLFYRISFVVFMTSLCIIGFLLLSLTVDDPIAEKMDFTIIYVSGLAVLGLCLVSMIRRVRGLSRYYEES